MARSWASAMAKTTAKLDSPAVETSLGVVLGFDAQRSTANTSHTKEPPRSAKMSWTEGRSTGVPMAPGPGRLTTRGSSEEPPDRGRGAFRAPASPLGGPALLSRRGPGQALRARAAGAAAPTAGLPVGPASCRARAHASAGPVSTRELASGGGPNEACTCNCSGRDGLETVMAWAVALAFAVALAAWFRARRAAFPAGEAARTWVEAAMPAATSAGLTAVVLESSRTAGRLRPSEHPTGRLLLVAVEDMQVGGPAASSASLAPVLPGHSGPLAGALETGACCGR
mmetsp:Transcript_125176/g.348317  ORF Transcript_125176/g.348317 Transcript_125176/m.348317 type:complete len:284 (+) Transcript_125176:439-1290(+)